VAVHRLRYTAAVTIPAPIPPAGLSQLALALKPSATLAVTARALELKRQGIDVVSMSAGEPDFDTPEHIKAAAVAALAAGKTKYTDVAGINELREALAAKFWRENGVQYASNQTLVSTGGKQSLANAFLALINPGDEVIIPAPFWVTYPEQVRMAGGVPVVVDALASDGYALDPDLVKAAITRKTKIIVLNSPCNPTGAVYSKATMQAIGELAMQQGLWIVSDEMYEHITYDGHTQAAAAAFAPEHVITINGASKAYSMTGWRIGFAAGPAPIIKAMAAIQGQITSNATSIAQYAALAALTDARTQDYIAMARAAFAERRNAIVAGLNRIGLPTPTPQGAFYVMADTSRIHHNEIEAARIILDDARVAVVPGTDFRAPGRVRLSYACSLAHIAEAIARIEQL
jgi:aspartate aminotransferase